MKKLYKQWFSSDNNAGNSAQYLPVEEQPWYIDTEEETSRGVEHLRSRAHTQARRDQKRYIVDAVLYEQFVQRRSGMNDSSGLAMTSYEISEACRNWANEKAHGDAIHGEKRRESLLNKYAGAAKRMSKLDAKLLAGLERLVEEDEESDEEGRGSQRKLRGGDDDGGCCVDCVNDAPRDSVLDASLDTRARQYLCALRERFWALVYGRTGCDQATAATVRSAGTVHWSLCCAGERIRRE